MARDPRDSGNCPTGSPTAALPRPGCFAISAEPPSETPPNKTTGKRRLRWIGVLAAAVLLPKCLWCVAIYLAVGAGLMRAAPELCGGMEDFTFGDGAMALTGLALGGMVWLFARNRRAVSGTGRPVR